MHIRETVNLNTVRDADIIAWLKRQDNKSAAIRDALRAQCVRQTEYTLADIMQRLNEIERRGVVVAQVSSEDNGDEPEEAVIALDGLGL